jgi:hypothetical protein
MKPCWFCKNSMVTEHRRRNNISNLNIVRFATSLQPNVHIIQFLGPLSSLAHPGGAVSCSAALSRRGPLSGINVINYYGPRIYESLGIDNRTSLMIIGISGAFSIVYCTVGLWLLEKVGRVKPLIISAAGLGSALVVNAALSQHLDPNNGAQLRAMVAMNFVFSFFYTPLGIISWVYPAEIFPVQIRNQGNSITTFTNWVVNLIFAQFSPSALSNIGFRYFYVFFVFNLIAMIVYILFFPETKGKTLEQMDEMFGDQLVPHVLEDSATTVKEEFATVETKESV